MTRIFLTKLGSGQILARREHLRKYSGNQPQKDKQTKSFENLKMNFFHLPKQFDADSQCRDNKTSVTI